MSEELDWKSVIDEAAMHGKFEIIVSDDPQKHHDCILYTAQVLRQYITLLDDAGYCDLPGVETLEFLSAVVLSLYKTVGIDIEI